MDFIPLIRIKDKKPYVKEGNSITSFKEILSLLEKEKKIYILDLDGIEKDKPNLCTYQRLPIDIDLWIDSGPRDLGDIVDATMSGATEITLRKKLCPQLLISEIKEITENAVYENIDLSGELPFEDIDGFVNFNNIEKIQRNFKYSDFLKQKSLNNKVYSYEQESKNINCWKYFNAQGLLVDINKLKEFKNAL